ncbi:hypothetical protein CI102_12625 [Trichoderma harzianum]|nr:hypothetical protein CI102_12625 [Trichoderma harzianum]
MTFANRSWYLGWLNLSTRIRNSIKKRRGKKLMVDDYSSLVQIKQKGQKRKKKGRSETIHTLLQSRPRKSRLLVRNASQQQQPQPIGLNFLDGGFLFFFHQRELLADDTRALLPFLFFDSLHHDAKKSLRLLLFFLGLLFFYASHTISISHLLHIFFFLVGEAGMDWTGMEDGHMGWRDVQALGVYGGKDFFLGVFLYAYETHKAKNTMATLQINYIYHPCIRFDQNQRRTTFALRR